MQGSLVAHSSADGSVAQDSSPFGRTPRRRASLHLAFSWKGLGDIACYGRSHPAYQAIKVTVVRVANMTIARRRRTEIHRS
jgi:hypothetical protein